VFTCNTPEVVKFRRNQQDILWAQLDLIHTPPNVEADIRQGILSLEVESQTTDLAYCTQAALAQAELTWSAFLRGKISIQWQYAYNDSDEIDRASSKWASSLVLYLLQYSQQLWIYRCGILHGHDKESNRQRHREDLLHQIQVAYEDYHYDPFCVPSDWRSLFHRPLPTYWLLDRDTLACWLRSYSEAKQQQALSDAKQQQAAARLFAAFKSPTNPALEPHQSLALNDSDTSTVASDSSIPNTDVDSLQGSLFHLSDDTVSGDGGEGFPWEGEVCFDDMG
jgi:hypothetical protein